MLDGQEQMLGELNQVSCDVDWYLCATFGATFNYKNRAAGEAGPGQMSYICFILAMFGDIAGAGVEVAHYALVGQRSKSSCLALPENVYENNAWCICW